MAVEIETRFDGKAHSYTFTAFPINIGRARECELQLPARLNRVSRNHACIDLRDGRLVLMDKGSTNGIFVRGARITGPVVLTDEFEFEIEGLTVTGRMVADTQPMDVSPTLLYAEHAIVPGAICAAELLDAYREARTSALEGIAHVFAQSTDGERRTLAHEFAHDLPEWLHDPDFQAILARHGIDLQPARRLPVEAEAAQAALVAVRAMAAAYMGDIPPPMGAGDIQRFMENVNRVLRVLLEGKATLDWFLGAEDAEHLSAQTAGRELGRELLDWRGNALGILTRMEVEFLAMADRHARRIAEKDAIIKRILVELSPAEIEWPHRGKRWHGPFWPLSLYPEFVRRHARIVADVWPGVENGLPDANTLSHESSIDEAEAGPKVLYRTANST